MPTPAIDPAVAAVLVGVVLGSALPWPLKALWRILRGSPEREANREATAAERDGDMIGRLLDRGHEVETMLEVLRKALDKNLVRENAVVTAAELLLGIVELIDKPTSAMKTMRLRAIAILALARRMNGSGS